MRVTRFLPFGRARGRGHALAELMMSLSLFALILVVSFLPFKMIRDSCALGSNRADLGSLVRIEVEKMTRNLEQGVNLAFSPGVFPRSATYTSCSFQPLENPGGITVTYSAQYLAGSTTEMGVTENRANSAGTLPGYPRPLIPGGITSFYFQPTQCLSAHQEHAYVLMFIQAWPSNARRPLPDAHVQPLQFATGFVVRNGGHLNPNLYP